MRGNEQEHRSTANGKTSEQSLKSARSTELRVGTSPRSRLFHGGFTSEPVRAGGKLVVHVDSTDGISEAANAHSVNFDAIPLQS